MVSGISSGVANPIQKQNKDLIDKRYNEIYAHEQKHKNAAGEYGGSIVIEKDSNGIPTGGHVDIKMPVLDEENPDKTIKHADTVINSAMAPSDPSNQDYKVAAEARSVRMQAENAKNKQCQNAQCGTRLNIVG